MMNMILRAVSVLTVLTAFSLATPAFAQSNDFLDDPAQSTQRDEAGKQGLVGANRTITSRTQAAVKSVLLQGIFRADSGAVNTATGNQQQVSVSVGTDEEFPDLLDASAIWANAAFTSADDRVVDYTAETLIRTGIVGYDKFFMDNLLVGIALGRTHSNTDSISNFGGGDNSGENEAQTSLYTLYGAYILNDNVFFDATVGLGDEEVDFKAFNIGTGAATARSTTEGLTRFASVGVTAVVPLEEVWAVTGNANVFRSITEYDAITDQVANVTVGEQQSDVTLLSLGLQVARSFENGALVPYAGLALEHNFQDQLIGLPIGGVGVNGVDNQTNDKTQALVTLGLDFYPTDAVAVSLEGQRYILRSGQSAYGGFFNFRYNF
ncbi:autotransporter outer membrane beta-barrel domain-containing protein [Hwanghaeella grinnelliae]|uniref:Autotransporter outer membrane beta-barrel domain-containing protein n=1 Tax=Hwanghaeella grinnelliae TaxID=2500179 RepID=A0A3S2WPQ1_9PROT|nr:autotransporter outer membrane beta-barrel domain-containing protein [Hwanghaeella grinnelliae]RVU34161.1 autotransporter outer membrane beta-barrel domain-containing protein [Hwanghaeella grinnelliae]